MLNQAAVTGHIGHDLESRTYQTKDGETKSALSFSIGNSRSYTSDSGEKITATDWIRITCFGALADNVLEFCRKGSKVTAVGRLTSGEYIDKGGVKHFTLELNARSIDFLGHPDERIKTGARGPVVLPDDAKAAVESGDGLGDVAGKVKTGKRVVAAAKASGSDPIPT